MLKLSKKVDYALIALNCIVSHQGEGSVSARQIALEYNIPVELLAKVLQRLAREGMISGHNGPKGGYELARSPALITVAHVVEALDGPIRIADCFYLDEDQADGMARCHQMDRCNIRTPVDKIQASIVALLEGMTLAQINILPDGSERGAGEGQESQEQEKITIIQEGIRS